MRRSARPGTWRSWSRIWSATCRLACDVVALDLHVDRRRQSEVENLGDDVGGQEIEGDAGKLAAAACWRKLAHIVRGRAMRRA